MSANKIKGSKSISKSVLTEKDVDQMIDRVVEGGCTTHGIFLAWLPCPNGLDKKTTLSGYIPDARLEIERHIRTTFRVA